MLKDAGYALDYGCRLLAAHAAGYGLRTDAEQANVLRAYNGDWNDRNGYVADVRRWLPLYTGWLETRPAATGADVLAEALRWVGTTQREAFDTTNGEGGVFGYCEAFVESCHERLGVPRTRYANALAFLNDPNIPTQPLPAPAGSCVLFGRATDPAGHVAISDGAGGMIGTTADGIAHTPVWAGCVGWQWYPGVSAATPPIVSERATIAGNPYGAIALHPAFADRWYRLDALGLAFPTLGYATEPPVTLATGRVMQRFERAVLATSSGDAPWNVVSLLLSELPPANAAPTAVIAPAPTRRVAV